MRTEILSPICSLGQNERGALFHKKGQCAFVFSDMMLVEQKGRDEFYGAWIDAAVSIRYNGCIKGA